MPLSYNAGLRLTMAERIEARERTVGQMPALREAVQALGLRSRNVRYTTHDGRAQTNALGFNLKSQPHQSKVAVLTKHWVVVHEGRGLFSLHAAKLLERVPELGAKVRILHGNPRMALAPEQGGVQPLREVASPDYNPYARASVEVLAPAKAVSRRAGAER